MYEAWSVVSAIFLAHDLLRITYNYQLGTGRGGNATGGGQDAGSGLIRPGSYARPGNTPFEDHSIYLASP